MARRPRRWLRTAGRAAAAAGVTGILAMLVYVTHELVTGPPVSMTGGLRVFVAVMPAAVFAPIIGTLPVLAVGKVVQSGWRGRPPLALWAAAGAAVGLVASLLLASTSAHPWAAAFGALVMLIFGHLDREEEQPRA